MFEILIVWVLVFSWSRKQFWLIWLALLHNRTHLPNFCSWPPFYRQHYVDPLMSVVFGQNLNYVCWDSDSQLLSLVTAAYSEVFIYSSSGNHRWLLSKTPYWIEGCFCPPSGYYWVCSSSHFLYSQTKVMGLSIFFFPSKYARVRNQDHRF